MAQTVVNFASDAGTLFARRLLFAQKGQFFTSQGRIETDAAGFLRGKASGGGAKQDSVCSS